MEANAKPEGEYKPASPAPKKKGSIVKRHSGPGQLKDATPDNFISYALQTGRTIDEIQQLIKFRNDELARVAELEFNEAKANFLKHCPAIVKNREAPVVTKDGKTWGGYKYSDLDNLINTTKEAEANAGLSHDWEDGRNEKGEMVVTCILSHVNGHKKKTTLAWPFDKSGGKNDIQAMKSTISYLRRATLESVLGVSQGGEDNDARDAPGQNSFTDLETLSGDGFLHVMKSISMGSMTIEQVTKTYALTAEQLDSLQRIAPPKNPDL